MKIFTHWKVIVAIVLVFVAGIVSGSVLTVVHFKHAFERALSVENWTSETMKILQKDLKLTAEQQPKVRAIVQETGQQFKQTFHEAINVSATNLVICTYRIDQVLTPEQRAIHQRKFQEFRDKLKQSMDVELPPVPEPKPAR